MTEPKQPVTINQGALKATIWENQNENGPSFNTTLSRVYRDDEGKWQETQNFRQQDLLGVSELGRTAHHRVNKLKKEHYAEHKSEREAHKDKRRSKPSRTRKERSNHSYDR